MAIKEIARLGIEENGKFRFRIPGNVPLHIIKEGLISSLESVIEMEVKDRLESKIISPSGKPYMASGQKGS